MKNVPNGMISWKKLNDSTKSKVNWKNSVKNLELKMKNSLFLGTRFKKSKFWNDFKLEVEHYLTEK